MFGSSLIALAVSELAIRILGLAPTFTAVPFGEFVTSADPELLWEPRAGHGSVSQDGFRGAAVERPKRRPRLVFAGDSIAYGLGLEDHQTIPARLAEHLRSADLDVEVLNAGVAGYNTIQEARRLEVLLPGLQADQVILLFCLNDFQGLDGIPEAVFRAAHDEGAGRALGLVHRMSADSPIERTLIDYCHLYRLLHGVLGRRTTKILGARARAHAHRDLSVVREGSIALPRSPGQSGSASP